MATKSGRKSKTPTNLSINQYSGSRIDWIPPHPALGVQLLASLEENPLEERDIAGVRLPKAIYMHFTAQEIRNLKEIFDFFDSKHRGNLKPKDVVYAMRTLGVFLTVEQCVDYIEKESRDTTYIDLNDLRRISENTGLNLSELELQSMFIMADRNGDGRIDRSEFIKMMGQTNLFIK
ncbi:unnamed protein product [Didymodactylos carnosus]|uniref:EF-hand domain-containing protein n=1 Tax=Didymodactylos carnosus TaxID=1234261 RepID=A0A814LRF1_9BILA|nr:unnamed protein product [Didymodactylos carnosus]CAF3834350.1 unnamed protein product [Didymodactylos carnosus]